MNADIHTCRGCQMTAVFVDRKCPKCGRALPGPKPGEGPTPEGRGGQIMYLQVPDDRYEWLKQASEATGLKMAEVQRGALSLLMAACADPAEARAYLNDALDDLVEGIAAS